MRDLHNPDISIPSWLLMKGIQAFLDSQSIDLVVCEPSGADDHGEAFWCTQRSGDGQFLLIAHVAYAPFRTILRAVVFSDPQTGNTRVLLNDRGHLDGYEKTPSSVATRIIWPKQKVLAYLGKSPMRYTLPEMIDSIAAGYEEDPVIAIGHSIYSASSVEVQRFALQAA